MSFFQRFSRKERLETHARYRDFATFMSDYKPRCAKYVYEDRAYKDGCTLLDAAASNGEEGLKIIDQLLKDGADTSIGAPIVILLSSGKISLEQKITYTQRLLDAGANINALYMGNVSAIETLAREFQYSEKQLKPLYDVFFAQANLDLHAPTSYKATNFYEVVQKWGERRPDLLKRINAYLK